ncbi:phosphonate ABC transporter ATP-binding protein [Georgenia deserti]|uniref:Phosphonate ABC transporter ATP-binding protein n=1 Tax=Georgenia deserti TaxID=2093781 RepID=A0ABW4L7F3_9MICO
MATATVTSLPEPAVRLEAVTKRFGAVTALDEVTLDLPARRMNVLLGLSGSGKSTLLRHLNGLHRPTSGRVTTLGVAVHAASDRDLRDLRCRVGMIFQHFHLVGPMSVLENVCTGKLGSLRGPRLGLITYPRAVREAAMAELAAVGLADKAFQRADTLSGGQQQRVAIARALIQQPTVLLADEPVASLDPITADGVMDLLARIGRERELTVVCSLHQVDLALAVADRVVGLRAGSVVLDRDAAGLSRAEALTVYDPPRPAEAAPPDGGRLPAPDHLARVAAAGS